ncbi:MAG: Gfo/Idh/MocA family oxidoreductase [Phycisphaerae bacterium]|jgi:hypothetical protein|nr:Gfo/Idh/MocA family oxidoreductase [Phycisphaerae bacterium]
MGSRISRRKFLQASAAGAAGITILKDSASARTYKANNKLGIAIVGCAGRGEWFVATLPKIENVVAMCDVDERKCQGSYRRQPDTPKFRDFRKMLDKFDKQIDAVFVATPDNTHAVISVAAMKRGKGVFCEKPLSRDVWESRVMRDTARKHKVATQMGNQGTATPGFRRAMELIQGGAIGQVRQVYVYKDGAGQGNRPLPKGKMDIPKTLDWDLWLGPAADRDFHTRWMRWHGWRDFGTCKLGNWASHSANLAFKSLKIDSLWYADPKGKPIITIEAKVPEICRTSFPKWEVITYKIPARGDLPALTLVWGTGPKAPGFRDKVEAAIGRGLDWGDKGRKKWDDHAGAAIIGGKGKVDTNGHNTTFSLVPADDFKDVQTARPEKLPKSRGHEREFFEAVRGGKPAWSNFDYAACLNEFLQLGNVATMFQGPLEFDPLACAITNNKLANAALRREYRKGWSL